MTKTAKAIHEFMSGFGIPAYDENTVPDEAVLPYITYSAVTPRWDTPASMTATVWYSGTSLTDLFAKVDEIDRAIGGGANIQVDGGSVFLTKGSPFDQMQPTNNDKIKAVYLLIGVQSLCFE